MEFSQAPVELSLMFLVSTVLLKLFFEVQSVRGTQCTYHEQKRETRYDLVAVHELSTSSVVLVIFVLIFCSLTRAPPYRGAGATEGTAHAFYGYQGVLLKCHRCSIELYVNAE